MKVKIKWFLSMGDGNSTSRTFENIDTVHVTVSFIKRYLLKEDTHYEIGKISFRSRHGNRTIDLTSLVDWIEYTDLLFCSEYDGNLYLTANIEDMFDICHTDQYPEENAMEIFRRIKMLGVDVVEEIIH